MKKSIILFFFLVMILSTPVFGAERVDMIVLLDNSVSVLPYYEQIQDSLLKKIISEHLRPGDTFNLITFADFPEVEISREIKNEEDIEGILAYSSLLQPMGNYTDLVLALRFLYKYTLDLPLSNKKKIVILTDGIHDPPPGSPYLYSGDEKTREEVKKASDSIHREGWDVSIVEISEDEINETDADDFVDDKQATDEPSGDYTETQSEPVNVLDTVSESLGSEPNVFDKNENDMAGIVLGIPEISIPGHLGETNGTLEVPITIRNRSNEALLFSLSAVIEQQTDLLRNKESIYIGPEETDVLVIELELPEDQVTGEQQAEVMLKLVGGIDTEPKTLVLRYNFQPKGGIDKVLKYVTDWRVIALLIGIAVAVIIILIIKKSLSGRPVEGILIPAAASVTEDEKEVVEGIKKPNDTDEQKLTKRHEPEEIFITSGSSAAANSYYINKKNRPVQMHVFGQNTKLGIINVKWLGLKKRRVIGSSASAAFRIFFIKVPHVLAEIECTGKNFIFYPVEKEYFPELKEPLHECLYKKIKIVTPEGKLFYIEFRQWISELERLNRLLTMTKHPGSPDFDY